MATKRPTKGMDAAKGTKDKREQSNVRLYWEQCDLINELADAARCSVADAVEKYLDGSIREMIRKLLSDRIQAFDASSKSNRSSKE